MAKTSRKKSSKRSTRKKSSQSGRSDYYFGGLKVILFFATPTYGCTGTSCY